MAKINNMKSDKELEKGALEEVSKILKFMPQENLDKIKYSFENFDPQNVNSCIYGLAYGNCNSVKSIKMIKQCCRPEIIKPITGTLTSRSGFWMSDLENYIALLDDSTEFRREDLDDEELEEFDNTSTPAGLWVHEHLISKI